MLKIKDLVDLKELEKFGFDKYDQEYSKMICEGRRGQAFFLSVYENDSRRILWGYAFGAEGSGEDAEIDNTIFDLIQAGLVEKV